MADWEEHQLIRKYELEEIINGSLIVKDHYTAIPIIWLILKIELNAMDIRSPHSLVLHAHLVHSFTKSLLPPQSLLTLPDFDYSIMPFWSTCSQRLIFGLAMTLRVPKIPCNWTEQGRIRKFEMLSLVWWSEFRITELVVVSWEEGTPAFPDNIVSMVP